MNTESTVVSKCNIVVFGDAGVGKSAFTIRFIASKFVETYDPTIEARYNRVVDIDISSYMLTVFDTAGQDDFRLVRDMYFNMGDAFICIYSITNTNSFNKVNDLQQQLVEITMEQNHIVLLVGNKSDLSSDRAVPITDGVDLARKLGWGFMEGSAKTGENVSEAFLHVVGLYHKQKMSIRDKTVTKRRRVSNGRAICVLL
eukprot:TRINITY_DN15196_c0_g1_i1.p1 TRINITY_DN15196_c0_g1~~TRINITY_DN15196_c0_g1_i1.p1  ORF type:complete len:200 (-),score=38.34 TRINITY_DN15196_c0_g1_i1:11-610(-)